MPFTKLFAPLLKSALAEHAPFGDKASVVDLVTQYSTCQAKRSEDTISDYCDEEGCGCENGWHGLRHHPLNDYEDFMNCHDCGHTDPDCRCDNGCTQEEPCMHEESCYPKNEGHCKCGLWADLSCVIHGFIHAKDHGLAETYEEWTKYIKGHELVKHSFSYMDYDSDDDEGEEKVDCYLEYCLIHKKGDGKYETLRHEGKKLVCECKRCRCNFRVARRKRKAKA